MKNRGTMLKGRKKKLMKEVKKRNERQCKSLGVQ